MKITRQCKGYWSEEFPAQIDEDGNTYYMLTGHFVNREPEAEDTDQWALEHGYIAVTPTTIDMTCHRLFSDRLIGNKEVGEV